MKILCSAIENGGTVSGDVDTTFGREFAVSQLSTELQRALSVKN